MTVAPWHIAAETVSPHLVRIATPGCSGTGFLVAHARNHSVCGIATAAHVIQHAHEWDEPIRIEHTSSGEVLLLKAGARSILLDAPSDTAAIVFQKGQLPLPSVALPLLPVGRFLKVGVSLGWLGYPAVWPSQLCFFGGRVSCWAEAERAYLIDGVAINGVSGAPAFHLPDDGQPIIIGVISAYIPNQTVGGPLPGLSVARDVTRFQQLVEKFRSTDDAMEAAKRQASEASPASEPGV